MKLVLKLKLVACMLLMGSMTLVAQVGIGTRIPDSSAMLHVFSPDGDRGVLLPSISLTGKKDVTTIKGGSTAPVSLLIYNTATAGTAPDNVEPGFYYWSGTEWLAIAQVTANGIDSSFFYQGDTLIIVNNLGDTTFIDKSSIGATNDSLYIAGDSLYLRDTRDSIVSVYLPTGIDSSFFYQGDSLIIVNNITGDTTFIDKSSIGATNDSLYIAGDSLFLRDTRDSLVSVYLPTGIDSSFYYDGDSLIIVNNITGDTTYINKSSIGATNDSLYIAGDSLYLRDTRDSIVSVYLPTGIDSSFFYQGDSLIIVNNITGDTTFIDKSSIGATNDSLYIAGDSLFLRDTRDSLVSVYLPTGIDSSFFYQGDSLIIVNNITGDTTFIDKSSIGATNDSLYIAGDSLFLRDTRDSLVSVYLPTGIDSSFYYDGDSLVIVNNITGDTTYINKSSIGATNDSLYIAGDSLFLRDTRDSLVSVYLPTGIDSSFYYDGDSLVIVNNITGDTTYINKSSIGATNDSLYIAGDSLFLRDTRDSLVSVYLPTGIDSSFYYDGDSLVIVNNITGDTTYINKSSIGATNDSLYIAGDSLFLRDTRDSLVSVYLPTGIDSSFYYDGDSLVIVNNITGDTTYINKSSIGATNDSLYIAGDSLFLRDTRDSLVSVYLPTGIDSSFYYSGDSLVIVNNITGDTTYINKSGIGATSDSLYIAGDSLFLRDTRDSILSVYLPTGIDSNFFYRGDSLIIANGPGDTTYVDKSNIGAKNDSLYMNATNDTLFLRDSHKGIVSTALSGTTNDSLYVTSDSLYLRDSRGSILSTYLPTGIDSNFFYRGDSLIIVDTTNGNVDTLYIDKSNIGAKNDSLYMNATNDTLFLRDSHKSIVSTALSGTTNDSLYVSSDSLYLLDSRGSILSTYLPTGIDSNFFYRGDSLIIVDTTNGNVDTLYIDKSNIGAKNDSLYMNATNDTLFLRDSHKSIVSTALSGTTNDSLYVSSDSLYLLDSRGSILSTYLPTGIDSNFFYRGDSLIIVDTTNGNVDTLYIDKSNIGAKNDSLYMNATNDTLFLRDSHKSIVSTALSGTTNDSLYVSSDSLYLLDSRGSILSTYLPTGIDSNFFYRGDSLIIVDTTNGNVDTLYIDKSNIGAKNDSLYMNATNDTLFLRDSHKSIVSTALSGTTNDSLYVSSDSLYLLDSRGSILSAYLPTGIDSNFFYRGDSLIIVDTTNGNVDTLYIDKSNIGAKNDSLYMNATNDTLFLRDSHKSIVSTALSTVGTTNDSLYVTSDSLYLLDSRGSILSTYLPTGIDSNFFYRGDSLIIVDTTNGNVDTLYIDKSNIGAKNDSLYMNATNDTLFLRDSHKSIVSTALSGTTNDSLYVSSDSLYLLDSRGSILSAYLPTGIDSNFFYRGDSLIIVDTTNGNVDTLYIDKSNIGAKNDSLYMNATNDTLFLRDSHKSIVSTALSTVGTTNDSLYVSSDSLYLLDSRGSILSAYLPTGIDSNFFYRGDSLIIVDTTNGNVDTLYIDKSNIGAKNDSLYMNATNDTLFLRDSHKSIVSTALSTVGTTNDSLYVTSDSLYLRDSRGSILSTYLPTGIDSNFFYRGDSLIIVDTTNGNVDTLYIDKSNIGAKNDSLYMNATNDTLFLRDSHKSIVSTALSTVGTTNDSLYVSSDSLYLLDSRGSILSAYLPTGIDSNFFYRGDSLIIVDTTNGNVDTLYIDKSNIGAKNDSLYMNATNDTLFLRDSHKSIVSTALSTVGTTNDSLYVSSDSLYLLDSRGSILSAYLPTGIDSNFFYRGDSLIIVDTTNGNVDTLYIDKSNIGAKNDSLYMNATNDTLFLRDSHKSIVSTALSTVGTTNDSLYVSSDSLYLLDSRGSILSAYLPTGIDSNFFYRGDSLIIVDTTNGNVDTLYIDKSNIGAKNDSLYMNATNDTLFLRDSHKSIVSTALSTVGTTNDSLYVSSDSLYLLDSRGSILSAYLPTGIDSNFFYRGDSLIIVDTTNGNVDTLYIDKSNIGAKNDSLYMNATNDTLFLRDSHKSIVSTALSTVGTTNDSLYVSSDSLYLLDSRGSILSAYLPTGIDSNFFYRGDSLIIVDTTNGNVDTLYIDKSNIGAKNDSLYMNATNDTLFLRDSHKSIVSTALSTVGTTNDSLYVSSDSLYLLDSRGSILSAYLPTGIDSNFFYRGDSLIIVDTTNGNVDTLYIDKSNIGAKNDSLYMNATNDTLFLRDSHKSIVSTALSTVGTTNDSLYVSSDSLYLLDSRGSILSAYLPTGIDSNFFYRGDSLIIVDTTNGNVDTLYIDKSNIGAKNDSLYMNATNDTLFLRDSHKSIVSTALSTVGTTNDSLYVSSDSLYLLDSRGSILSAYLPTGIDSNFFYRGDSLIIVDTTNGNVDTLYIDKSNIGAKNDSLYMNATNDTLFLRDSHKSIVSTALSTVGTTNDSLYVSSDSLYLLDSRGSILSAYLPTGIDSNFFYRGDSLIIVDTTNGNVDTLYIDKSNIGAKNDSLYMNATNDTLFLRDSHKSIVSTALSTVGTTNDSLYVTSDSLYLRDSRGSIISTALDSVKNPFYKWGTKSVATNNTDSVYIMGSLGVGTDTAFAKLDVNGDLRVQQVTDGLYTDSLLVIDTMGVVKKVSQSKALSTLERPTGETWIQDTVIYTITFEYDKTTVGDGVFNFGIAYPFPANYISTLISARIINQSNNGIANDVQTFDPSTNEITMGTGNSLFPTFLPGKYWITLQYTRQ